MSSTPDDSAAPAWGESLPYTLWRTHNAVNRHLQAAIKDLDVTVTQLGLAVHLHQLGALSASDLARGVHITPQSVATALARLDTLGWVRREPHPVHGRVILFSLTERGAEGVVEGSARMAEVTDRVRAALTDGDAEGVLRELRRITADLEGDDRPVEMLWPLRRP